MVDVTCTMLLSIMSCFSCLGYWISLQMFPASWMPTVSPVFEPPTSLESFTPNSTCDATDSTSSRKFRNRRCLASAALTTSLRPPTEAKIVAASCASWGKGLGKNEFDFPQQLALTPHGFHILSRTFQQSSNIDCINDCVASRKLP